MRYEEQLKEDAQLSRLERKEQKLGAKVGEDSSTRRKTLRKVSYLMIWIWTLTYRVFQKDLIFLQSTASNPYLA